ncbi:transcriptional activator DEMETER-like isoform X2 [Punica granatum]|uniref:Transcriptional activator DEMETER-like isoform X2 n=1 Tax=Punica granatum TaxID=22663 RepID=A0A6P8E200_PUNGR|nr:transcriptional activator DEMETER-like isoform X2 [Punica granatum]
MQTSRSDHQVYQRRAKTIVNSIAEINAGHSERKLPFPPKLVQVYARRRQNVRMSRLKAELADSAAMDILDENREDHDLGEGEQRSTGGELLNFVLADGTALHGSKTDRHKEVWEGAEVTNLLDAFSAEDAALAGISFTELLSSSIAPNIESFSIERISAVDGDRNNGDVQVEKGDAGCFTSLGLNQARCGQATGSTASLETFSMKRGSAADGDQGNGEDQVAKENTTYSTSLVPDQACHDHTTGSTSREDAFAPPTPLHSRNVHKIRRIGIDLNKAPRPKPRKKKHAIPKIATGKPVRTPKLETRENGSSTGKRKYVRKNVVEGSSTPFVEESPRKNVRKNQSPNTPIEDALREYSSPSCKSSPSVIQKASDPTFGLREKSCKRRLNFDEFPKVDVKGYDRTENFDLNLLPQELISQPRVQGRVIRRSQCLIGSRKVGPNFPEIYKGKRTERHRKAFLGCLPCFPRSFKKKRSIRRSRANIPGLWLLILEVVHEKQRKLLQRRQLKMKGLKVKNAKEKSTEIVEGGQQSRNNAQMGDMIIEASPKKAPKKRAGTTKGLVEKLLEQNIQKLMRLSIEDGVGTLSLVPYKPKQKAPKVLLDAETMRAWNKLMMLEYADNDNSGETEKDERWERERDKFRLWVENFTAYMHMILGDRRFTPWKGSVVDSVVGVFLTQNVSDYLSSSAFMSLCAKFPPKSANEDREDAKIDERAERIASNAGFVESETELDDGTRKGSDECSGVDQGSRYVQNMPSLSTESKNLCNVFPFPAKGSPSICLSQESSPFPEDVIEKIDSVNVRAERRVQSDPIFEEISEKDHAQVENETASPSRKKKSVSQKEKKTVDPAEWERLRKIYSTDGPRPKDHMDSVDWEAVRCAKLEEVAETIRERGQHYIIASRIQEFLTGLVTLHGSIDLEWLRNCPPNKAKDYLLKVNGLGLKSVECVRLLCLRNMAFPVDTNVGRIAVRLGWVPLLPLPDNLQLHLLEKYPIMDEIQRYLWPRICTLHQRTLYELHYHLITFGKVFCTKRSPNCNACPLRGDCKHFASAFASSFPLPPPRDESVVTSVVPVSADENNFDQSSTVIRNSVPLLEPNSQASICQPIIEEPATPEPETCISPLRDIEDLCLGNDSDDEIPTIKLNSSAFVDNLCSIMNENNRPIQDASKALVVLTPEAASIPSTKLKYVGRLRTEHEVYELPDDHPLVRSLDRREPDDPCPYLLAIWPTGPLELPESRCESETPGDLCNNERCLSCHACGDWSPKTVKGTILIPCRTAMRGSFPLNGTYFQVNEVFADDESSRDPIDVPRDSIWFLTKRIAYFGTSTTTILRGLPIQKIQKCFWQEFVCVRGFDRKTRAPRPLSIRFHRPTSKTGKGAAAAAAAADDE